MKSFKVEDKKYQTPPTYPGLYRNFRSGSIALFTTSMSAVYVDTADLQVKMIGEHVDKDNLKDFTQFLDPSIKITLSN